MALKDITKAAVLAAIAECEKTGQDEFRRQHGFGEARAFVVEHAGQRYDSKAIAGVAHGYLPGHRALRPDEFSGGKATVVPLLRGLGFRVIEVGSPAWAWDELVLVCDLMAARSGKHVAWSRLLEEHDDVIELSRLLQLLPLHPMDKRGATFRSPGAVARKGENIRQWHRGFDGTPSNGGQLDKPVHDEFIAKPQDMHAIAVALRTELLAGRLDELPAAEEGVGGEAFEGSLLQRRSIARERNPKLRREKIKAVMERHGRLACEVCAFDFKQTYGDRGSGFAEIHHAVPLHVTGPTKTRLSDLVVLCSNCHRMIHRGPQWLTPAELSALIAR